VNLIKLKVEFVPGSDAEPGVYPVTPVVQVAFEREFRTGLSKAFQTEMRNEHLYWLAWKAMHVAGKVVKPFDGWLNDLAAVEIVNENTGPTAATV
jgi:hypothetical protein